MAFSIFVKNVRDQAMAPEIKCLLAEGLEQRRSYQEQVVHCEGAEDLLCGLRILFARPTDHFRNLPRRVRRAGTLSLSRPSLTEE